MKLEESNVLVVMEELVIHVKELAKLLMVTMVIVATQAMVVILSRCRRGSVCLR